MALITAGFADAIVEQSVFSWRKRSPEEPRKAVAVRSALNRLNAYNPTDLTFSDGIKAL